MREELEKVVKMFDSDITVDPGERAVVARISTGVVDRDGEVVIPQGCNSKEFETNPVVFFNHSYRDSFTDDAGKKLPVGKCVAIKRDGNAVIAKTVFAQRPENYPEAKEWLPDTLLSLYQQGVLKGFSVGFMPTETRPATTNDKECFGQNCRRVTNKWKMLEYSCSALPCNQDSVAMAVSKGWVSAETAKSLFGEVEQEEKPEEIIEPTTKSAGLSVNSACEAHAMSLTKSGDIDHGAWDASTIDRSAKNSSKFLATDSSAKPSEGAHWKYPIIGNDGKLNRNAVGSAQGYAEKNGESAIASAAKRIGDAADAHTSKKSIKKLVYFVGTPATDSKSLLEETVKSQIQKARGRLYLIQ